MYIDFIEMTFNINCKNYKDVVKNIYPLLNPLIKNKNSYYIDKPFSYYNCNQMLVTNGINIMFDTKTNQENCYVQITGKQIEAMEQKDLIEVLKLNFEPYMSNVVSKYKHNFKQEWEHLIYGKVTRIDVAFDDYEKNINYYIYKYKRNEYVTTFKIKYMDRSRIREKNKKVIGKTIYFGVRPSNLVRIYDKVAEIKQNNDDVDVDIWTRIEYECRKEFAQKIAYEIVYNINNVPNILMSKFRIIEKRETKLSRSKIDLKFLKLLNTTDCVIKPKIDYKKNDGYEAWIEIAINHIKQNIDARGIEWFYDVYDSIQIDEKKVDKIRYKLKKDTQKYKDVIYHQDIFEFKNNLENYLNKEFCI